MADDTTITSAENESTTIIANATISAEVEPTIVINGSIKVGTTTTGETGSNATVSNSGSSTNVVLNFGVPKGEKGDTGATGADGKTPVKGTDYFTASDISEMESTVQTNVESDLTARTPKALTLTWAEIKTKITNGDFSGIDVGDYKNVTLTNGTVMCMVVAGINTFKDAGYGNGVGGGIPNHIDFISRDCYPTSQLYNSTDNNNGNSANANPFMASALYTFLNSTLYFVIPSEVSAVIGTKSCLMPTRYVAGSALTDDNSWAWQTPKIWLPNEIEVFGTPSFSTKPWAVGGGGNNKQYEIFRKYPEQLVKHSTNGGTGRVGWWLSCAYSGSSTYFCRVYLDGTAGSLPATCAGVYVPLCFRVI